jgi:WD40 repeat protein/serine/threonine protein kinase/tetratricopeptide (TPR) repeat protein
MAGLVMDLPRFRRIVFRSHPSRRLNMADLTAIESIFFAALEKPSAQERASFLNAACGADSEIRRQVERLLTAQPHAEKFMNQPAQALVETAEELTISEAPGTLIGPYKLLEQIGEGGFGVVFMAEQQEPIRRMTALKVLKPGMDTRQIIARFEAERQALALMDHLNIAKVLDAGQTSSGRPYFVMDLVKGLPITEFCDQNRLTTNERLELFVSVCRAVQHAHQKGIIHRDIKPSNVLVTLHDGTPVPKIIDFGIAKALGRKLTDKSMYTGFAQLVGTPLYMSPEQAELSGLDIDTRTDIYSLGLLLYELLTGTTPFDKERFKEVGYDEIRRIIREEEPPKPSTRISTKGQASTTISTQRKSNPKRLSQLFRGELDWIVMKALEKDRNRRYETASAFAADVQRYLHDEPVHACPPSAWYRFRKLARRNKRALAAVALIAGALVMTIVVMAISNDWVSQALQDKEAALKNERTALAKAKEQEAQAKNNAEDATKESKRAREEETRAKANELLARRRFYAAQMNLAMQAWEAGNPARVLELLEGQRPKFDQDDLRGFEWYYLWRLCQSGKRFTLRGYQGEIWCIAFSPDGQTLASASWDGDVNIWDVATGKHRCTLRGHSTFVQSVAFSPDGKTLASGGFDGTVKLWDVATWRERAILPKQEMVPGLAFSPDGKILAIAGGEVGTVVLWDVAKLERRATLRHSTESRPGPVAFSPDGMTLASGSGWGKNFTEPGIVKLWDLTAEPVCSRLQLPTNAYSLAFDPDGKTLAVGNREGRVELWDATTGKLRASQQGHRSGVHSMAFAPDSKTVASCGKDRTVKLWDVATWQERATLAHRSPVLTLAFAPDSKTLASGSYDSTIALWDIKTKAEPATVLQHAGVVCDIAFARDGKTLVSAGEHSTTLWDVATGQTRVTLPRSPRPSTTSPPGSRPASPSLPPTPPPASKMMSHARIGLAVSPDGMTLASSAGDETAVKLWDLATGHEKATLNGHTKQIYCLSFSPDGRTLASGAEDGIVKLWDLATQQARATITRTYGGAVTGLAFSPDGKTLVSVRQFDWVHLWDAATGQERATFQGHQGGWNWGLSVAFSPDGKTLATGNDQGTVKLWDAVTGELRASFKGHTDCVNSVAFFPDGKILATGSEDTTVRLWDVATGQERVTLKGHKGGVAAVAITRDGKTLASGSADGTLRIWHAATDAEASAHKTELDPDDPDSPVAQSRTGERLWQEDRVAESKDAFDKARLRLENLAAHFPDVPDYRQELVHTLLGLSRALADDTSRAEERDKVWSQMLAAERTEPEHLQRALLARLRRWGGELQYNGQTAKAEQVYQQTLKCGEALLADKPPSGPIRGEVALTAFTMGRLHIGLRQYDKAIADYSKAIELAPKNAAARYYRGLAYLTLHQYEMAIADYSKAIELNPNNAVVRNNLAWLLSNCPEVKFWDASKAVAQAKKAVELTPTEGGHWNTLGAAHYRAGEWKAAVEALSKSDELLKGDIMSFNAFFLAMAHWQLGEKDKAQQWYEKAVQWMDQKDPKNDELRRFRAEAAELLGVQEKQK